MKEKGYKFMPVTLISTIVFLAAVIALIVLGAVMAHKIHDEGVEFDDAIQKCRAEEAEYINMLSGIGRISDAEDVAKMLEAMQSSGNGMAAAQNEFFKIDITDDTGDKATNAYKKVVDAMSAYSMANTGQWYYPSQAQREHMQWQFEGTFEKQGTGQDGVWTLYDDEGYLLAFAKGKWTDAGKYDNITVDVTSYGQEKSAAYADTDTMDVDEGYEWGGEDDVAKDE